MHITEEMQNMLEKRQKAKFAAIRENPIYDRELQIPVRGTMIRCLEYIPSKEGTLPVVFDMHGGGFTNGYPEEDDYFCRQVCDKLGVRVFSIDYRLAPIFSYPEGQLDVYAVISYFVDHAAEYGVDTNCMLTCGHSAGANFALTAVMRANEDAKFSFRGMILDYPPLDLATPAEEKFYVDGCIPIELSNLFNACYVEPEKARDPMCSPRFADDETIRALPPATVISCEIDSLREEDEEFAARLAANGVEVTVKRFLGQKHAFTVQYDNPVALEAIDLMIKGIQRYLFS